MTDNFLKFEATGKSIEDLKIKIFQEVAGWNLSDPNLNLELMLTMDGRVVFFDHERQSRIDIRPFDPIKHASTMLWISREESDEEEDLADVKKALGHLLEKTKDGIAAIDARLEEINKESK